MTPRLYLFSAGLLAAVAFTFWLMLRWPDDESGTTLRQKASDVIGLIGGLLALLSWALTELPRLAKGSHRQVIR